jgi:hypothetical protein
VAHPHRRRGAARSGLAPGLFTDRDRRERAAGGGIQLHVKPAALRTAPGVGHVSRPLCSSSQPGVHASWQTWLTPTTEQFPAATLPASVLGFSVHGPATRPAIHCTLAHPWRASSTTASIRARHILRQEKPAGGGSVAPLVTQSTLGEPCGVKFGAHATLHAVPSAHPPAHVPATTPLPSAPVFRLHLTAKEPREGTGRQSVSVRTSPRSRDMTYAGTGRRWRRGRGRRGCRRAWDCQSRHSPCPRTSGCTPRRRGWSRTGTRPRCSGPWRRRRCMARWRT